MTFKKNKKQDISSHSQLPVALFSKKYDCLQSVVNCHAIIIMAYCGVLMCIFPCISVQNAENVYVILECKYM